MVNTRPTSKAEFGKTAGDYARHREGFPPSFFAAMKARGLGLPGQTIIDLGTGTGTIARGLATHGARVTGVDQDPQMLEKARELASGEGLKITLHKAPAEATGLETGRADAIFAGQCWHWFDAAKTCEEVKRLLKPGGHLVIAHFDWLPLEGNVVQATEALILAHNPKWRGAGGMGLYPLWLKQLAEAGYMDLETFSFDEPTTYTHEAWRGRIRASAGIAALDGEARETFDTTLKSMLADNYPEEPLQTPHRVWVLTARPGGKSHDQ